MMLLDYPCTLGDKQYNCKNPDGVNIPVLIKSLMATAMSNTAKVLRAVIMFITTKLHIHILITYHGMMMRLCESEQVGMQ